MVSALVEHNLALRDDGTVWAWGRNDSGQLGDRTMTKRTVPVKVFGLTGVTMVSAGVSHSLALKGDGTVWAWGDNNRGQLGDGTTTSRKVPVQVSGLTGVTMVSAGWFHNLALKSDGTVWAWGDNEGGQLGDGTFAHHCDTPVHVIGTEDVTAVSAAWGHSLALKSNGTLWAWGDNSFGQAGEHNGPKFYRDRNNAVRLMDDSTHRFPVQVPYLSGVTAITAGWKHSLASTDDETVWAWGLNVYGELGDGTDEIRNGPVRVVGLKGIAALSTWEVGSIAVKTDGTVWIWGNDENGQFSNGTSGVHFYPVHVASLKDVKLVRSNGEHSLAVLRGVNHKRSLSFEKRQLTTLALLFSPLCGVSWVRP